ncbi:glycosyltransferase family 2 protein [Culicoidibacter larvae]|uniref:Glycosyltransferase family 2 protein n=1 Tax=Culicoidibacter larvae TaxID=2579976 RepID=A0A5R8QDZ9_9FIRM|nr:glycosyltransferase [Culicoidibacter larvae]TLG75461.1 glycosyltransferase family 2 protein [Culicoidibacter larvae]
MAVVFAILLVFSVISIWLSIAESLVIIIGALRFHFKKLAETVNFADIDWDNLPMVTVIVPAHDEEPVIGLTMERILAMNYPRDRMQLIVMDDNSSDKTALVMKQVKKKYEKRDIIIQTISGEGQGGGKSKVLNLAREFAVGEYICIYDADAAPERNALLFLVRKALEDPKYGAIFGRNKARNRDRNFLTQMINLELVVSQRIVHTGRWELFRLGQIPGTNFIIKRSVVEEIGGWDEKALTEDTELGFAVMTKGYRIALESRSEAYQQEPEQVSVYVKQRTRWAKGNLYVVVKNLKRLVTHNDWRIKLETFYYISTYFWFLLAVVISDILFLLGIIFALLNLFGLGLVFPIELSHGVYIIFVVSWGLMYTLYVLQINLALVTDKGQSTVRNFIMSCVSYFTYAQLFILISLRAYGSYLLDVIFKRKSKWYKTERY